MTDMLRWVLLAASAWIELSLIAKATVVLLLALGATQLASLARASVRHILLAAAFCVLATLPLMAFVMPPVQIDVSHSVVESSSMGRADSGTAIPTGQRTTAAATSAQEKEVGSIVSMARVLRMIWALGAVVFLSRMLAALIRLRRIRRRGLPWLDTRTIARRAATEVGINRQVDVLVHEDIPAPMTAGWFRPTIMLPVEAREWTEAEGRNAFVHELEHVRRADWATQVVARFACGLYWFHPLVWTAWRRMTLDAERACDDAVLRRADGPTYARQLVDLAHRLSGATEQPALGMAHRSHLSARVSSILNAQQSRGRARRWWGVTIALVAILTVLTLAPLRASIPGRPALPGNHFMQTFTPAVAGTKPAFEVASVKRHHPDDPTKKFEALPGGKANLINQTLQELITSAYQTQNYRLLGGPDWFRSETYDVIAKAEGEPSLLERLGMVRQLLADRFKLVMHKETRDLPIYKLVMARRDGKLGPQIKPATCTASPKPDVAPGQDGTCGGWVNLAAGATLQTRNRMTGLANMLGRIGTIGRPVIDQTGLTDEYAYELKWTPEQGLGAASPGDADAVSVFTALQEQLGLKLEATRGPVEVLVIDSVDRPTEN